jgi:DNA topoisomerase-2
MRSIPNLCDGFKPSQRKILHFLLKKNSNETIKVAQLSGYVAAETEYHHGEASLQGAIINMNQDFVGSNNINLLFPDGNFGTRYLGGKDAASPRYIFTKLNDITKLLFHKDDLPLFNYINEEGTFIEPDWFLPIIPMILVNGCTGIGTGFSTHVPTFNPKDIISNLLLLLDGKDTFDIHPWFKGFNGSVIQNSDKPGYYTSKGKWSKISDTQIKITELPIGTWVTNYKEFTESLIESNIKKGEQNTKRKFVLKDAQNKTRDENSDICFILDFKSKSDLSTLIDSGSLEKELKLEKPFNINNMYLFDKDLKIKKYNSPIHILSEFFHLRLSFYTKRKIYITQKLNDELIILQNKSRFINEYINKQLDINNKSKIAISDLLSLKLFHQCNDLDGPFDYLLRMPIYSLTLERILDINKQCLLKQQALDFITSQSNKDLWKSDLSNLNLAF